VCCVATLLISGCGQKIESGHKKAVNAANTRWKSMRSGMMLQMAQQQFDTGDLDQAEKTLAEAIAIDAENARLHTLAGRVALERGQLERAYKRLELASSLDPKLAEVHYFRGIVLQRWSRYEDSLAAYEKATELQEDNVGFLLAVAEMLVALDRQDDAIARLEAKVATFDQNAGIRTALGQLYSMQGKKDQALAMFHQAALLRPDDVEVAEEYAQACLACGQTADAIRIYEKLVDQADKDARSDLKRSLAGAYVAADRLSDAKQVYIELTRENPQDVDTWIRLGELAWRQNDTSGALVAANRVMAVAPRRPEGYIMAGMVWQQRQRVDEALRLFDRAAVLAPESAEPVILRGLTLQRAGKQEAAAAAYQEALRRQPDDSRARSLLASVSSQP
jgi:tetratricopeptide (TPR) repeat protein